MMSKLYPFQKLSTFFFLNKYQTDAPIVRFYVVIFMEPFMLLCSKSVCFHCVSSRIVILRVQMRH